MLVALPVYLLGALFGLSTLLAEVVSGVVAILVMAFAMQWRRENSWEEEDINAHYAYVCESCKNPTPEADCACVECGFNPEDSHAGVHLKR